MTLPMALTLSRLVLAPFILVCYVTALLPALDLREVNGLRFVGWRPGAEPVAALLLVLAATMAIETTDVLDGYFARRWKQVSDAGKFLDPLADSISRSTVFLCFLAAGYVPVWMVALIFYRESVISGLRIAGASQRVIIAARWSGKSKAILQGFVINLVIGLDCWRAGGGWPSWMPRFEGIVWWSMAAVTAVTVLSSVDYFRGNRAVLARVFAGASLVDAPPPKPPAG